MPSKVVAVTSDMFVQSRVQEAAKRNSVPAEIVTVPEMIEMKSTSSRTLVLLDLASADYDPFQAARTLKRTSNPPDLLGFYPHVRKDLKKLAEENGFDHIITNHDLLPQLMKLLGEPTRAEA